MNIYDLRRNDPDKEFMNIYDEALECIKRVFTAQPSSYIKVRPDIIEFVFIEYDLIIDPTVKTELYRRLNYLNGTPCHIIVVDDKQNCDLKDIAYNYFIGRTGDLEIIIIVPIDTLKDADIEKTFFQFSLAFHAIYDLYAERLPNGNLKTFLLESAAPNSSAQLMVDSHCCKVEELPEYVVSREIKTDWCQLFKVDYLPRMMNQLSVKL